MRVDPERPVPVTPEGLAKIREELAGLRARRMEIAQRIRSAKEFGDLTENAEYDDAKNEQGFVEGRILELEKIIRNADLIEHVRHDGRIRVGSTVVIGGDGGRERYTIVGPAEVDAAHGRISNESPVGKALLGRQVGDVVTISTPNGPRELKIVEVL